MEVVPGVNVGGGRVDIPNRMITTQANLEDEVEVMLRMLSRGFLDLHLGVRTGDIVDPYAIPETMGEGMQMLSKLCVRASVNDLGDSIHCLSDTARRLPVGDWGVPALAAPFRFAEVRLLSNEPVAPTEECRALAAKGQPDDAFEDIHHRQLREIVRRVRTEGRLQIYSLLRERIVRKPVYDRRELSDFLEDHAIVVADDVLRRWSTEIPLGALRRDGSFNICRNCGGLLYPHRDKTAFPDGRCRIGACLEEVPSSRAGATIESATGWRVFTDDILAYWVGPGLAEIRLHDELRRSGVDVMLYPRDDTADVGRSQELGIDVKSYSCPRLLGETLSDRLGGLATFDQRYVAIPDSMVNRRPHYLDDLRRAYTGTIPITFAKVSDVAKMVIA
jgi:REase associating with pPIWI_RE/pPIWI_RE three-gene island domain Y